MKVIVLYGEMGAGKNYHGERLAQDLGMPFFDGDLVIPPDMRERIRAFKPVLPATLDRYVNAYLGPAILERVGPPGIVVAQALYLRRHREALREILAIYGLDVEFRHIEVGFAQHMRQLWGRRRGLAWVLFALFNKLFFEP